MNYQEAINNLSVSGMIINLPAIQLDRDIYLKVKKAMKIIGGKWKGGRTQGFVFSEDPTPYLTKLQAGEKVDLKKEFQFFETPPKLADHIVNLAEIEPDMHILEPSAGRGAIVDAIHRVNKDVVVHVAELMDVNIVALNKLKNIQLVGRNFMKDPINFYYDRVIANPPFAKNQDIDHILRMCERLRPGGRLVSIASLHWSFSKNRKETKFRDFLKDMDATVYQTKSGAFQTSGTMVSSSIIVINI